jgi:NitT/TauT family transport system substrate-binding protein
LLQDRVNIGLLTTNALAEEDPELVHSVVDVHAEATEFMADNPEVWAEETVETFGLDPDVVDTAIENIWPRWELDTEYIEQVQQLIAHMADLDQIETEPDVDDVIDPAFAGE